MWRETMSGHTICYEDTPVGDCAQLSQLSGDFGRRTGIVWVLGSAKSMPFLQEGVEQSGEKVLENVIVRLAAG
jgi:hypothetical protein